MIQSEVIRQEGLQFILGIDMSRVKCMAGDHFWSDFVKWIVSDFMTAHIRSACRVLILDFLWLTRYRLFLSLITDMQNLNYIFISAFQQKKKNNNNFTEKTKTNKQTNIASMDRLLSYILYYVILYYIILLLYIIIVVCIFNNTDYFLIFI